MKMLKYILLCATALAMLCSCSNGTDEQLPSMDDGEGVLSLNLKSASTTAINPADTFVLRIYQLTDAGSGNVARNLVRKYTSLLDVPQYVWLLAGNYVATVEVGDKVGASFDKRYYKGEKEFTITSGAIATADVVCAMQNIPVEVSFDATVAAYFTKGFEVNVCANDVYDVSGTAPTLKYTESATGYFMMPESCTTFCWKFEGKDGENQTVAQSGTITGVEASKLYRLSFVYSKDAGGFLTVEATVDTSVDHREDNIAFNPDPVVKGDGFDLSNACNYISGERSYIITALDNITLLTLSSANGMVNLLGGSVEGITVTTVNPKEIHVTLAEAYFNSLPGGENELIFRVNDASGGIGYVPVTYGIQGVNALSARDYDLWFNTVDLSATVFNTSATAQIGFRKAGEEWQMNVVSSSSENTVSASTTGITAGTAYEYALFLNSVQTGKVLSLTTETGAQIPDSGFENWYKDGNIWCPYASPATAYWGSGNNATASLLGEDSNLTVASDDIRPGSTGTKSAYMHSLKASVMGIGKFAAGNLFVGRFVRIKGTNGIVDFGQPFTYNARPKALRFWMKNHQGTINEGSYASGLDLTKIFVCLSNRTAPYTVDTSDSSTLFDPRTAPDVIAYSYYETTDSHEEWTEIILPLEFQDENTIPNYLILTYTCSGYGDYFTGSTESWMRIDDVEFIY